MLWYTILAASLSSLIANKMRSALAVLGIVIGVASVISLLALGAGAQKQIMNSIAAMGTDVLMIWSSPGKRRGQSHHLTMADAQALVALPEVHACSPVVTTNKTTKYFSRNNSSSILGVVAPYLNIRNYTLVHGRGFNDAEVDGGAPVAVLGATTAKNLFDDANPIGETITIDHLSVRVIGTLATKGGQSFFDSDDYVLLPISVVQRYFYHGLAVNQIIVQSEEGIAPGLGKSAVEKLMRRRHHLDQDDKDDVTIQSQSEMLEAADKVLIIFKLLLGGIGGISLFVGGIGIMNIMLVSVTERTREIGVRKAIGARNRDIMRQFLVESVVLTSLGGLAGVGIGVGMMQLASLFLPFSPVIEGASVITSLGFSAAVGIFFGYYPALRAARLDPIEALRYE